MLPVTTDRLILRKFTADDLIAFTNYRNDPAVAKYQSWSSYSEEDADKFFSAQKDLEFNMDETWYQIAIVTKDNQKLIGDVAVHFFDGSRQAELGFTMGKKHQKQGYALEAVTKVVELLFTQLNKHRLIAIVDTRNSDAIRLLRKLNFTREAHYVENILFKGEWSDEYSYALLNKCKRS